MFIDSHAQNSKNYMIFGRDASLSLQYEDIHCRRVRWSEVILYENEHNNEIEKLMIDKK